METPTFRFVREHHCIAALLRSVADELARTGAAPGFTLLARHVRGHFRHEEETIFPAVERVVADLSYPVTAALRREHEVCRRLIEGIGAALDHSDVASAAGDLLELEAALQLHTQTEERVLYPIAATALCESDRSAGSSA